MILTAGVDNTNVVLGCFDGNRVCFTTRIATDRKKTGIEYAISIRSILELYAIPMQEISGSIFSCVVPALALVMREALRLLFHREPLMVGPGVKSGISIVTESISTVGGDLVAMAAAAVTEYAAPMILVDLDTATVMVAIDERKRFTGTVIAPGAQISAQALAQECDNLPQVIMEAPREIIGKNTSDSMRSGIIFGTAAMVDGMVERISEKLGGVNTIVATGSLAGTIVPHCRSSMQVDDLLLLKGLKLIYDRNQHRS